jgi:hypothetical protein
MGAEVKQSLQSDRTLADRLGVDVRATRGSVRLVVWGATDDDRRAAEVDARADQRVSRYRIVEVVQAERATAASGATVAIARRAVYDQTWAIYRAPEHDVADPAGPSSV